MVTFLGYFVGLIVVAAVLFFGAAFVFGRGEELAAAPADSTPLELPDDRPVRAADLRAVRLPVVLRGYRMTEIDWLIEEMALALETRDHQIATLEAAQEAQRTGPEPRYHPESRTSTAPAAFEEIEFGDELALDEPDQAQRYRADDTPKPDASEDHASEDDAPTDHASTDHAAEDDGAEDDGAAPGNDASVGRNAMAAGLALDADTAIGADTGMDADTAIEADTASEVDAAPETEDAPGADRAVADHPAGDDGNSAGGPR